MIKRLFSYIIPIKIYEKTSKISNTLEVSWNNGKLVLDSKNTNYSYGSLQKVLRKGLIEIGFKNINQMEEILVLGVAGGSVVKTLVDEIHFEGNITGVEIDDNSIEIANQYFGLSEIKNYKTIIGDAKDFISKTSKKYDLIIIDIFEDNEMPAFLFQKNFVDFCKQSLNINGSILFNTMILDEKQIDRNNAFLRLFDKKYFYYKTFSKVEYYNQLIIIKRLE